MKRWNLPDSICQDKLCMFHQKKKKKEAMKYNFSSKRPLPITGDISGLSEMKHLIL